MLLKRYTYHIVLFMLCDCLMINEEGSVNSSVYLSKEGEVENFEVSYLRQCLDSNLPSVYLIKLAPLLS